LASVIIVDDYAELRSLVAAFLNAYSPVKVIGEGKYGNEAVEMVEQLKPQIVLMDILMPVMDGFTATQLIKERHPDVYVILYSGGDVEDNLRKSKEVGADLYLTKPLDLEKLVLQINELLSPASNG
jgi:DNA-binding NarL/FixJ family response regulator